jgi:hypothetical protein
MCSAAARLNATVRAAAEAPAAPRQKRLRATEAVRALAAAEQEGEQPAEGETQSADAERDDGSVPANSDENVRARCSNWCGALGLT